MAFRLVSSVVLTAMAYSTLTAQPPASVPSPPDQFVTANGVRLQYVDWGGTGAPILLLPGLGDDVHRFDPFAPRFTDAFHVVGFSRRGQGASDASSSKYDTETLVEDIRQFLATMRIEGVNIIGHSIAGLEMTAETT